MSIEVHGEPSGLFLFARDETLLPTIGR